MESCTPVNKLDRAAIMRDAHVRYRRRRGTAEALTFGEALRRAWAAARERQDRATRLALAMAATGRACRVAPAGSELPAVMRAA